MEYVISFKVKSGIRGGRGRGREGDGEGDL